MQKDGPLYSRTLKSSFIDVIRLGSCSLQRRTTLREKNSRSIQGEIRHSHFNIRYGHTNYYINYKIRVRHPSSNKHAATLLVVNNRGGWACFSGLDFTQMDNCGSISSRNIPRDNGLAIGKLYSANDPICIPWSRSREILGHHAITERIFW